MPTIEPTPAGPPARARSGLARATGPAGLVAVALVVVYLVWGSTYLGIRVLVEEAPPLTASGARYVAAGMLLGILLTLRGGLARLRVTWRQLAGCATVGLFLPVLGNGLVSVGEDHGAPSGVTALLIAIAPLMITVFRFASGDRPRPLSVVGVLLGLVGLGYLVLVGRSGTADEHVPLGAALIVLLASTFWAFGSWVQPRLWLPEDAFVMTVHEMWTGGAVLVLAGLVSGERPDPFAWSGHVWLVWGYLVVFGSMVAFTAYVWLLGNAPISLVATYAYVNPVVAVILGALILDEPITPAIIVGGAVIVVAVALVISVERVRTPQEPITEQRGSDPV